MCQYTASLGQTQREAETLKVGVVPTHYENYRNGNKALHTFLRRKTFSSIAILVTRICEEWTRDFPCRQHYGGNTKFWKKLLMCGLVALNIGLYPLSNHSSSVLGIEHTTAEVTDMWCYRKSTCYLDVKTQIMWWGFVAVWNDASARWGQPQLCFQPCQAHSRRQ